MNILDLKKSSGLRTEPWGTPHPTFCLLEAVEPIWVDSVLPQKYDDNQTFIIPLIP